MSEVLVLGAGMVGVSTALALQARGHSVTLADRRPPGRETSYGNAGAIQVEAAEPYAIPRDLSTLMKYALGQSNDVVFSLAGVLSMLPGLVGYWRNSAPHRHARIAQTYSRLVTRASDDHAPLIEAAGAGNLISRLGLGIIYRNAQGLDRGAAEAEHLQKTYGVRSRILDGESWRREDPAYLMAPAGGVHYLDTWSCSDPGGLTLAYARLFQSRGGRLVQADADGLQRNGAGWRLPGAGLEAEAVVLCFGPWTGAYLKRFGLHVPMVLKRGYHRHYHAPVQPRMPALDSGNGVVLSPMLGGVRMATGAALVRHDAPADSRQLDHAERGVADLLDLGERVDEPLWFGTRPCLPGMLPMVGPVPGQAGLWLNFGHGHQGFTLGPTTAELLADAFGGTPSPLLSALSPAIQLSR